MKKIIRSLLLSLGFDVVPRGSILMNARQMANFLYFSERYSAVRELRGNIVECGVGRGRSILYFSYFSWKEDRQRTIWGFDSFEGFPEPAPQDSSHRNPKKGDWSDVSITLIRDVLRSAGIPATWASSNVKLVKGYFSDTLDLYDKSPIAILHIDADLYQSYAEVLTALYPHVVPGGQVLFDEYGEAKWPGAKQAVDEFFTPLHLVPTRHEGSGKYYIVKP